MLGPRDPTHVEVTWLWEGAQEQNKGDVNIHWFSILNSVIIIIFLFAIISIIIVKTIRRDINQVKFKFPWTQFVLPACPADWYYMAISRSKRVENYSPQIYHVILNFHVWLPKYEF